MEKAQKHFIYSLDKRIEQALNAQEKELHSSETLNDDLAMFKVIEHLRKYISENRFIQLRLYKMYQKNKEALNTINERNNFY
ncbi:hypothetical protein [Liquorilactobacillus oeni]|uniref:Uncharacterized protein n=1 Tax=Liquorilactobacillus oeni DSM 19972 TaxID=1423777 RepID=A0A0R1M7K7_9LACO|nr:hypothetical protein [Liquorilactobacillus oeni]KRL04127.1 hypothetical protein FD46_GL001243 [Liquorilactobacillus oeni DSM 19972]